MKPKILVVDDDPSLREFLEIFLASEGYRVESSEDGDGALSALEAGDIDCVLSDIKMPGMDGVSLLKEIKARWPKLPVILITAFASLDSAVEAMREGAWDYVTKPFQIDELKGIIERALDSTEEAHQGHPSGQLHSDETMPFTLGRMVAKSPKMKKIFELIPRVASSPSSVLITGESGTGKELIARALHNLGSRRDYPFVVVNCGGIPENLLESELFGYVKGAFTGADRDKEGLFMRAHRGTIFLDEVGELPLPLQVKLLRVLQEKAFCPLGSTEEKSVDVRIIAATNRDLEVEVMEGRFREDLYYRLNVIHIHVPPLRERPEDIPILVQYFLEKYSKEQGKPVQGISSYAMEALKNYPFPGNVRELENIVERSVALSSTNLILPESLSLARFKEGKKAPSQPMAKDLATLIDLVELPEQGLELDSTLDRLERRLIELAMERANGSKQEAARILGINQRSLRYRLQKHGLL